MTSSGNALCNTARIRKLSVANEDTIAEKIPGDINFDFDGNTARCSEDPER